MRVAVAAICEEVRVRQDGRLDLIGVAPDEVALPQLPWNGALTLALILELGPDDDRDRTAMNISVIRTRDGSVVGKVDPASAKQPRQVPSSETSPVHVPFRLGLQVRLEEPGLHRVLVRSPGGEPLADVPFGVREKDASGRGG